MKKIRVGIIGQGRSGRDIHRLAITCDPKVAKLFEVAAVADFIPERCTPLADAVVESNFKVYSDYKEMLQDKSIDLIVNTTFSQDHIPVSIEALEAGFNVLCDKPAARSPEELDQAIAVAKRTGKFFNIFQQSRFRAPFVKCMEVMNSGVLGRIVMVKVAYNGFARRWDWQTLQSMNGGVLHNTGPHPLDQCLQFYGDADPEQIICKMDRANVFGDAEDHVKLLLMGKDHPTIDMEISCCCAFPGNIYEIYGTNGGLKADSAAVTWKYFIPEDAPDQHLVRGTLEGAGRLPAYCGEKLDFYEETWHANKVAEDSKYWVRKYYEQLYAALTDGKPMDVTLEQVRRQLAVMVECYRQNPFPTLDEPA